MWWNRLQMRKKRKRQMEGALKWQDTEKAEHHQNNRISKIKKAPQKGQRICSKGGPRSTKEVGWYGYRPKNRKQHPCSVSCFLLLFPHISITPIIILHNQLFVILNPLIRVRWSWNNYLKLLPIWFWHVAALAHNIWYSIEREFYLHITTILQCSCEE